MQLNLQKEALLRLFMGCQSWQKLERNLITPYSKYLQATLPIHQYRNQRTC